MGFLSELFGRAGRVSRGKASDAVSAYEDANFDSTVRQTIADMKNELNNVVRASAVAMSNYNRLDAEYQKYVRQSDDGRHAPTRPLMPATKNLPKRRSPRKRNRTVRLHPCSPPFRERKAQVTA